MPALWTNDVYPQVNMNEDDAKKRIRAIEKLQAVFDNRLASLDKDLLSVLLENADTILANPKALSRILGSFDNQFHVPVLQQFGMDLLTIKSLNDAYFIGAVGETLGGVLVNEALFETVKQRVESYYVERFGITAEGKIVSNGLFDLFSQDTTVRRQIQQFAYAQKASGIGLDKFKKSLRTFVEGVDTETSSARGIFKRHYDVVAYDTYQQADRVAQQAFSAGLGMTAFLYLGGLIESTRPFCKVRNGKCFLLAEIKKMGTSQDSYGGYSNKATGYFAGKSNPYDPFTNAGGWSCRHTWSAISDGEALRRRGDVVQGKDGQLRVLAS